MQTDEVSPITPSAWFLIARHGDMVVKLQGSLEVGEDEDGGLVLNPQSGHALVRLSVGNSALCLTALSVEMKLSEHGLAPVEAVSFERATRVTLRLPHNSLILAPDYMSGALPVLDRELTLLPTSPTAPTEDPDPPILIPEPVHAEPRTSSAGLEDVLPEDIDELLATVWEDDSALFGLVQDIPDEEAITLDQTPVASRPGTPGSEPVSDQTPVQASLIEAQDGNPLEVARLASAIASLDRPIQAQGPASSGSAPVEVESERLEPPVAAGRSPSSQRAARLAAAAAIVLMLMPGFLADPILEFDARPIPRLMPLVSFALMPVSVPAITPQVEVRQSVPAQSVLALADEAQRLYDAGSIITPVERNAVKVLIELLHLEPGHQAGLELMYRCAVGLLAQAQDAHDGGDEFLARNLVEEVLGFHPEFEDAKRLLESWSEETEDPDIQPGPPASARFEGVSVENPRG